MRAFISVLCLLAIPAAAQKPWETRVNLPVPVPVELPALPAANPFAVPVDVAPAPRATPLAEHFDATMTVEAAAYLDATGVCRRVVFTRLPLLGLAGELQESLVDTEFTPARMLGTDVPTWTGVAVDLTGRIDGGKLLRVLVEPPEPGLPPVPDPPAALAADARDLQLPATPLEQLDQLPFVRRFRTRVAGRELRQTVRFLAEVGTDGRCTRVVFLTCPEGLRPWLVASLSDWTFSPAQLTGATVPAWTVVDTEILVDVGTLRAEGLRLTRSSAYPAAAAAPAAGPPPGA